MEIIDELEFGKNVPVYGGAVVILSWNGQYGHAIAIRTAVIKDINSYSSRPPVIVADSQPRLEWKETME